MASRCSNDTRDYTINTCAADDLNPPSTEVGIVGTFEILLYKYEVKRSFRIMFYLGGTHS